MPDITSAFAVTYSNDKVRPLAEKMRAIYAEGLEALGDWAGEKGALFTVDPTGNLIDERQAEGVNQLTGQDVIDLITVLNTIRTAIEAEVRTGVTFKDIIRKACVRKLTVI